MKTKVILLVLVITLIASCIGVCIEKPNIHEATICELLKLDGIGEVLAERILSYLEVNPEATIEELINVRGIGEEKLKLLKGEYR